MLPAPAPTERACPSALLQVDDTRRTLGYAVAELQSDAEKERAAFAQRGEPWTPPRIGVCVVQNKLKPKAGKLPQDLLDKSYFVGESIPDRWCVYPWDAADIYNHTSMAEAAKQKSQAVVAKGYCSDASATATPMVTDRSQSCVD